MAKTKQKPVSAAQRREREKQQRQQRLSSNQDNRSQTRKKGKKQSQSNMRQWLLIGGVLVVYGNNHCCLRYHLQISNQEVQVGQRRPVPRYSMLLPMLIRMYWRLWEQEAYKILYML